MMSLHNLSFEAVGAAPLAWMSYGSGRGMNTATLVMGQTVLWSAIALLAYGTACAALIQPPRLPMWAMTMLALTLWAVTTGGLLLTFRT